MKNKYLIIIVLVLISLGVGIYFLFNYFNQNNNQSSEYVANRTEASISNTTHENSSTNEENNKEQETTKEETPPVETELSSFSTIIYSKDPARQNNVQITCSSLNDTIVENAKGYQKAEIFDAKRK